MVIIYLLNYSVLAERSVQADNFENYGLFRENIMSWTPIGHDNNPLIKCAVLLLKLELVKVIIIYNDEYNFYK